MRGRLPEEPKVDRLSERIGTSHLFEFEIEDRFCFLLLPSGKTYSRYIVPTVFRRQ